MEKEYEFYDLDGSREALKIISLFNKNVKTNADAKKQLTPPFDENDLEKIDERFWIPINQTLITRLLTGRQTAIVGIDFGYYYKVWSNWGDNPLFRKNYQLSSLGLLTAVRSSTVKKAVEFLGYKWGEYVIWAAGLTQYDKKVASETYFRGLVDAASNLNRPADSSKEPTTYNQLLPYRNMYDVLAWCYPKVIYDYMKDNNDVKNHLIEKFNIQDTEYKSKVLDKWKPDQREVGNLKGGEARTFYFNKDYFGDGGAIWEDTISGLIQTDLSS